MSSSLVARAQAWLEAHASELQQEYQALLRIASVESDPEPGAPFGRANREALDFMLGLGSKWGMAVKDVEGYCGFAEFGTGERMVMSMGHLDVVPVGPGWKYPPFGAEEHDGYVYARGAVDDKGPTIASFFAMRALQECGGVEGVRFRSFFGCNEESGFHCVHRYNETEEPPTFGVAPDSGWPLIHGEKGIANLYLEAPLPTGSTELLEVSGGQRPNIVIDSCRARLRVSPEAKGEVEEALTKRWDRNVTTEWSGDVLEIEAVGKAAHGAWPFGGDNAATRLFRFLREIVPLDQKPAFEALFFAGHPGGDGLGIAGSDEPSGALTANLGIVETVAGKIRLTVNVRYPVTWAGDQVSDRCVAFLTKKAPSLTLAGFDDSKPLYFPLDHPMVTAICEAYRAETGDMREPTTMGGGTYARAMPRTVSIGTGWDGDGDAHETDERLALASLHKMARIYAHIFVRLASI
ncbi:MAG: Sapep family Mn(2+)-dependent dipeptidase [Fimbriimonadaceae bacterium]|nr:Sapep family Mn(2+)-dependent dipeptidase [Fimbriimonadaceae bacterium]